jgi:iron(III) transport system permease protein
MIWIDSILNTGLLILMTSVISVFIGTFTALFAWKSNQRWAYFLPLLTLAVPPWLFTFYFSETFGLVEPWIGAAISLGVCCSVYPHSIISSSLANRGYKDWEMLQVVKGKNLKSLAMAVYPSLKISLLPSIAIIAAECITDFGVSNFYGLNTVTMLTYNLWTSTWNFGSLTWGLFILLAMGILVSRLETNTIVNITKSNTSRKSIKYGLIAVLPTISILLFGTIKSVEWIIMQGGVNVGDLLFEVGNSMLLVAIVVATCILVLISYLGGIGKTTMRKLGLASYAIPGTVVGSAFIYLLGAKIPLILLLVLAITFRYFGLIIHSVAVSEKGSKKYFEVIDFYTRSRWSRLNKKMRLMLSSITIGVSLIILDVLRELPISMVLQPVEFQTLAMRMSYISKTENPTLLGFHSIILLLLGIFFSSIIVWITYDKSKKSQH